MAYRAESDISAVKFEEKGELLVLGTRKGDVAMLRASNLYPLQSAAPAERHTGEVSGIEFVPVVRAAHSVLLKVPWMRHQRQIN